MKKYILTILPILLLSIVLFTACEKEASKPEEETENTAATAKFTWVQGSTNATADQAFFVPAYNNIYATKVSGAYVDITLDDLNKGTHTISPSSGITLEYSDSNATYKGKTGSVIITENTGTLLSGSYNCTLENGATISGSFANIPKK